MIIWITALVAALSASNGEMKAGRSTPSASIAADEIDWARDWFSSDPASLRRRIERSAAVDAEARVKLSEIRQEVARLGLQMIYLGEGCFGETRCERIIRVRRILPMFASFAELRAAWLEMGALVDRELILLPQLRDGLSLHDQLVTRLAREQNLRRLLGEDRGIQGGALALYKVLLGLTLSKIDRENAAWLKNYLRRHRWPNRGDVGDDGMEAAWIIMLHARHDPIFRLNALSMMEAEVQQGRLSWAYYATKEDHILSETVGWQRYGTKGD